MAQSSIDDFIKKAKIEHGELYNYSKVIYLKAIIKIVIVCKVHGDFLQTPNSHLNGAGCPTCGRNKSDKSTRKTTSIFIQKANKIHGDKYLYLNSLYKGFYDDITITCKEHGNFTQKARKHLAGQGCSKCRDEKSSLKSVFLENCHIIHKNKYEYPLLNYRTSSDYLTIICPIHGEFVMSVRSHYHKKRGCFKCVNKSKSKGETEWLSKLKIENRNVMIKCGRKRYCVDGYCTLTNTVYEYNGDFYHGNPERFKHDSMNTKLGLTFGFLYERTIKKAKHIIESGYNLISIWENDFNKQIKNERL